MGFKLTQSPTFWAAIEAEFAAEKGGKQAARFEAKFKRLSIDELSVLQERIRNEQMTDAQVARAIVVDWRGIEADDGSAAEFNSDNLDRLLNLGFGSAIALAFFATLPKAKAKN